LYPVADLIAQGADPRYRWRRALLPDRIIILGRAGTWPAPWDDRISRRHAELRWDGQRLSVRRLPDARNAIYFKGRAAESFELPPGDHFVIGETTFTLAAERVHVSLNVPAPAEEQAFSTEYLHNLPFRRVGPHIDVLSRLPELISGAQSDAELSVRLVNLLLSGLPRAGAAALVSRRDPGDRGSAVDVLHWDRRNLSSDDFQPSQRLILDALDRQESVLHVWDSAHGGGEFTINQGIDWAFCTPISGQACRGRALYVAGRFAAGAGADSISDPKDLRDDLKFTEIAATTFGALCDVRRLERERAGLSQFFSAPVLEALQGVDPDVALAPRETEVTVLFCDLRGFSRESERSAADLLGLLNRVSLALGVATRAIRAQGGVLGDFHGDAAMGFWGWPLAQPDSVLRAAAAALDIRRAFAAPENCAGPISGFQVGIGIATGSAVAGKIGTIDQVKVTVFGPVVNLASRLESMTKSLHAPVLLDERAAAVFRNSANASLGRLRRVARVRPYGMYQPLEVSELLPPASSSADLTDEQIAVYEAALDAFIAGDWSAALERLHRVPATDRVKDFLTVHIAQHDRRPPPDWNGVVALTVK
jgi:adenylate cyclase